MCYFYLLNKIISYSKLNQFKISCMLRTFSVLMIICFLTIKSNSQNYNFNFNSNGQRVCLAESQYDINSGKVKVMLSDHASNSNKLTDIYRRTPGGNGSDWVLVSANLPAGTAEWTDVNSSPGNIYEYQIKRKNSWTFNGITYDATGYTMGCALTDNTGYQGQMILLVANNISNGLAQKYDRLKSELTGEGWKVNEIIVDKAVGWNNGPDVVAVKSAVALIYKNAPVDDKPKLLFILGHVPMPRSGSTTASAPDGHDENKGARGFDAFYADIDGIYTDIATFNPGGLQTPLAINMPNDYKWDQDYLSSNVEMGFGRVDFENITDYPEGELILIERYLDKLSAYRNVASGWDMGNKTAFNFGYDNSNDASYRNLPNLSNSENVLENTSSLTNPLWVKQNGPFMVYMQNEVAPEISEWNNDGMDAAIYSSDQSYWGYNDVPQSNSVYSRIRSLPASNTKCIAALWTTAGANLFYQACSGQSIGMALKEVINHNTTNNKIERPQQEWDTNEWWNRTHFTLNGDPSIRLYQVPPAVNPMINITSGQAVLEWQVPSTGSGYTYNVYSSPTEYGKYTQMNGTPITTLNYVLTNYQAGKWYMVRSVKSVTSGCGSFYQPGLGVFAHSEVILASDELSIVLKAGNTQSNNHLTWIIAKKEEVNEFVIETSEDGRFYTELAGLKAENNRFYYSYIHLNVPTAINYYRIRVLKLDGKFIYSNIAKVNNSKYKESKCFPNPTSGKLTVISAFEIKELKVVDVLGRIIYTEKDKNEFRSELDVSYLSSGQYFLQLIGKNEIELLQFNKY